MATWRPNALTSSGLPVDFKRDDHADLAETRRNRVVHVARDRAILGGKMRRAAERHVLADRADHSLMVSADGRAAAGELALGKLVEVSLGLQRGLGDARCQFLERFVAGDEIGLGIDLDQRRLLRVGGEADQAFRGDAAGLLGGLGEALGPEPIDRRLDVAFGLGQRRLAIHHARAGLVAQVLHHGCGNRRHIMPLIILYRCLARLRDARRTYSSCGAASGAAVSAGLDFRGGRLPSLPPSAACQGPCPRAARASSSGAVGGRPLAVLLALERRARREAPRPRRDPCPRRLAPARCRRSPRARSGRNTA